MESTLTCWISFLRDPSDGAHVPLQGPPLGVVPVLPFLQQVLATAEVGVFEENPGACQDLARLDFLSEPLLLDRLHVVCQLQGLAVKVRPVEQLQLVRPDRLKQSQRIEVHFEVLGTDCVCVLSFPFPLPTYVFDDPAGPDAVVEAHPVAVFIVLPGTDDILVACEVVALVQNPPAGLYLDRVASVDEAVQVRRVPFAVVELSPEVPVLKKHNLENGDMIIHLKFSLTKFLAPNLFWVQQLQHASAFL